MNRLCASLVCTAALFAGCSKTAPVATPGSGGSSPSTLGDPDGTGGAPGGFRVLLFTRTAAFRHDAIPTATAALVSLGAANGYAAADSTDDPTRELVGAYFADHPAIQSATVRVEKSDHPATVGLPAAWTRTDEWYNFATNPRPTVTVLATLDESTYSGGTLGADHPVAWFHDFHGGRAFYTAMGHTPASYAEPGFRSHLVGALRWAAGQAP